jgi:hypothetical protein
MNTVMPTCTSLKKSLFGCGSRYWYWFFFLVILCSFSGLSCRFEDSAGQGLPSHPFRKAVVPVRYLETNSLNLQPTEIFHPGETPAVRIQSRSSVHGLLVIHHEGKRIVRGEELDLYPGKIFCQPFPDLAPGTYTAHIRTSPHSEENSCEFTVLEY